MIPEMADPIWVKLSGIIEGGYENDLMKKYIGNNWKKKLTVLAALHILRCDSNWGGTVRAQICYLVPLVLWLWVYWGTTVSYLIWLFAIHNNSLSPLAGTNYQFTVVNQYKLPHIWLRQETESGPHLFHRSFSSHYPGFYGRRAEFFLLNWVKWISLPHICLQVSMQEVVVYNL